MKIPKAVGGNGKKVTTIITGNVEGKDKKQSTCSEQKVTAQSNINALGRGKCPGLLSV